MDQPIIRSHDHREELLSAVHPASPVRRRGHQEMILTRRGWRSVTHLKNLAQACRENGVDVTSAFRYLGLA